MAVDPLPFKAESAARAACAVWERFSYLDDPTRLGAHMRKPALTMGGVRNVYERDAAAGRASGSVIGIRGSAWGLRSFADEIVADFASPVRNIWEMIKAPPLIVVSHYRLDSSLRPKATETM